jgi:hypothetical protein
LTTAGQPYWKTGTANNSFIQNFAKQGVASADAGTPTGAPSTDAPTAFHVYHGRQKGGATQFGVDGWWGPVITNADAALYWDSIGYDYHQLPALNSNPSTQHFEMCGVLYRMQLYTYALPDWVVSGVIRDLQAKHNLQSVYLGN